MSSVKLAMLLLMLAPAALRAQTPVFDTSFVFHAELNYLMNTKQKLAGSVYREFSDFIFKNDTITTSATDVSKLFIVDSVFYWENRGCEKKQEVTLGYRESSTLFYLSCRDSDNDKCGIAIFRVSEFKPYTYRLMVIYRDWFMAYLSQQ